MVTISKKRSGLGSEHPLCDKIQLIVLIVVWGIDSLSFLIFGYSTVLVGVFSSPLRLLPAGLFIGFGLYLTENSHKAVFDTADDKPGLIDSDVYAWVRHPMYLGILMFCLGFLFINLSLLSLGIWIAFFVIYDRWQPMRKKT
ncbi:MAG: hypothetical protein EFT35_00825 [Methanophagales archaeon ANME-1-THS]|nr:MAG: hypothetical protein EFT35_00825 [Methanophagales archaeon ANME-1-THS]